MKTLIITFACSCALLCAQENKFKVEELTASESKILELAKKHLLETERKIRSAHGDSNAATEGLPIPAFGLAFAVCRSGYTTSVELRQGYAFITSSYFNNCGGDGAFLDSR